MSADQKGPKTWHEIGRHVQRAPSPHNTQPYRLRIVDDQEAEVIFLPRRGLYVADPLGRFTWLTAGVFIEICSIAAHSLGFELDIVWDYSPMYPNGDVVSPQTIARLRLVAASRPFGDLDAKLILQRQTSRLAYDGTICPPDVIEELKAEAHRLRHE
jgi:hypothetical protein